MRTILSLFASLLLFGSGAWAQNAAANYPNKPIKIVVSVPAGGGVDTVTRIIGEGLHKKFGQPVVVENRSGAGGNIGAEYVFKADPDGYTLLASQPSPITVNPLLYKNMHFDPTKFEPVAIMTTIANVLLVREDFPAKTAQEFIAYCKANPGKVNYASQGIGTTSHLTAALFEHVTGTKLRARAVQGHGAGAQRPHRRPCRHDLHGARLRACGSHAAARRASWRSPPRSASPTCRTSRPSTEAGVKNFESGTWNAISAPPKTPSAIVAKLNKAINEVLESRRCRRISPRSICTPPAATRPRPRPSSRRRPRPGPQ